jgi:hypothetical protein
MTGDLAWRAQDSRTDGIAHGDGQAKSNAEDRQ